MRKIFILIAFLIFSVTMFSQQLTHYTNFHFNQFAINPALAGFKDCMDVNFAFRSQWVGFEGSPKTGFFGASGKLGKSTQKRKHGIGGMIVADNAGRYSRTNINAAYSYQFRWKKELHASIGLFVGVTQYRLDLANPSFVNLLEDPLLNRGSQTAFIVPEFTPGLWIYNSRFYFGMSVKSLTNNTLRKIGEEATLAPHIYMNSGKAYEIGPSTLLIPSAMLTYEPGSFPSFNLNMMVDYKQLVAGGIGFRNGDSVSALLKFRFLNHFTLGYAYDYTTSPIRLASSNTHEISLNIYACPGKFYSGKIPCAAYN